MTSQNSDNIKFLEKLCQKLLKRKTKSRESPAASSVSFDLE